MQNDILWHYRFPHDGWEYDGAVNELHEAKPEGVIDPYTPDGIPNPVKPKEGDDIGNDHTFSFTWKPSYPDPMRRVEAKSGSGEVVHTLFSSLIISQTSYQSSSQSPSSREEVRS